MARGVVLQLMRGGFVVVTACIAATAFAGDLWHVATDGSDVTGDGSSALPFATLQRGLDIAAPGDTVRAADGLYAGDGNRDLVFNGKAVVLESASGDPALCVIDCGGADTDPHRGFLFAGGEDSLTVVRGLTISGGYSESGAGILCLENDGTSYPGLPLGDGGFPSLIDCRITDCTGDGVATLGETRGPVLKGCEVMNNSGHGACWSLYSLMDYALDCRFNGNGRDGVNLQGGSGSDGNAFHGCEMSGNAEDGLEMADPWGFSYRFHDCTLSDNGEWGVNDSGSEEHLLIMSTSTVSGNGLGGIRHTGWNGGAVRLTACDILENRGVGVSSLSYSDAHLVDCRIAGNDSVGVRFFGNCLIVAWTVVTGNGAGLELAQNDEDPLPETVVLENVTIAGNGGVGLTYSGDDALAVSASIIAFNGRAALGLPGAAVPAFSCTDIHGNAGGDWMGPHAAQDGVDGNIGLDPLFCDLAAGDLELAHTSPCLGEINESCGDMGALGAGCAPTGAPGTPSATRLLGCAPNPFNPSTTIAFDLETGGPVTLVVYDLAGRRIRGLLDERRSSGRHDVRWDGRDDAGRPGAAGVYLCRLTAPGAEDAIRLMLVK